MLFINERDESDTREARCSLCLRTEMARTAEMPRLNEIKWILCDDQCDFCGFFYCFCQEYIVQIFIDPVMLNK